MTARDRNQRRQFRLRGRDRLTNIGGETDPIIGFAMDPIPPEPVHSVGISQVRFSADGRVAFYNMWTHAHTLHTAIEALLSATPVVAATQTRAASSETSAARSRRRNMTRPIRSARC